MAESLLRLGCGTVSAISGVPHGQVCFPLHHPHFLQKLPCFVTWRWPRQHDTTRLVHRLAQRGNRSCLLHAHQGWGASWHLPPVLPGQGRGRGLNLPRVEAGLILAACRCSFFRLLLSAWLQVPSPYPYPINISALLLYVLCWCPCWAQWYLSMCSKLNLNTRVVLNEYVNVKKKCYEVITDFALHLCNFLELLAVKRGCFLLLTRSK